MNQTEFHNHQLFSKEQDPVPALLDVISRYPLDPSFEAYGNFILVPDYNWKGEPLQEGLYRIWGNFLEISAVFNVTTDSPELVNLLANAIRKNQQTEIYRQARAKMVLPTNPPQYEKGKSYCPTCHNPIAGNHHSCVFCSCTGNHSNIRKGKTCAVCGGTVGLEKRLG